MKRSWRKFWKNCQLKFFLTSIMRIMEIILLYFFNIIIKILHNLQKFSQKILQNLHIVSQNLRWIWAIIVENFTEPLFENFLQTFSIFSKYSHNSFKKYSRNKMKSLFKILRFYQKLNIEFLLLRYVFLYRALRPYT